MAATFVHLHLHTEYSLTDGLIRIKPLIEQVANLGMPAVAVTDMSNLFAMIKFYKAARKHGIKPIIGAEVWVRWRQEEPTRLVLLCQNLSGFRNLTQLLSRSYLEGWQRGIPVLNCTWLKGSSNGLIALSGGCAGAIGQALLHGNSKAAKSLLKEWLSLFPNRFYLELQRTGRPHEEEYIQAAVELALTASVPVMASNDVRFLRREDFDAHEARVCIQEGYTLADPRRPRQYSDQQYLRTPAEMAELFADLPEAVENSVEIAKRCTVEMRLGESFLPDFPVPAAMSTEEFFSLQAQNGLEKRLQRLLGAGADVAQRRKPYDERLAQELTVINQMGFAGYFLIVADFIQWARDNGVPVGPGRGSGAGSLVAYALGITDLDPLAYDLLFERFLNPERVSMPDFDVDFCMEGRDRVIDYVAQRYGRDRVAQIATHGTMAAKAVVRDAGRVLGYPYGFVDRIAKLIPFEIGITLDRALEQQEELRKAYESDEEVKNLLNLARSLEGLARNVGKHAGGVVIAPSKLTDFSPLYCEQDSQAIVTQFDKDDVESAGLVKFDFLGLRTLTIMAWALQAVNRQRAHKGEPPLDISALPLVDTATFELLKACKTTAVFQLESRGMKDLIKRLQPDCFEDIVALVALFRPGPLQSGMVDDFINRKHGRAKVEYPHPDLAPILKPTYGVILYQEQVMQIAQVLANYTLGGADLLRRAMGKKKPEEMAKQRAVFVKGAIKRGVEPKNAAYIFDLMEKFAGYGFNKTVSKDTKVITTSGIKYIADCEAGDQAIALNRDGSLVYTRVLALHDHGLVPLWEVEFDDGSREKCTLDHKWLTRHGQWPLWAILQLGEQVWGTTAYQTRNTRSSETVSDLFEHDSLRPNIRSGTPDVLRDRHQDAQESQRAFSELSTLLGETARDSCGYLQKASSFRYHAPALCADSEENFSATRDSTAARGSSQAMAQCPPKTVRRDSPASPCFARAFQNGDVASSLSGSERMYSQCTVLLPRSIQTGGFYSLAARNRHRGRWSLALSAGTFFKRIDYSATARPAIGTRDCEAFVAAHPLIDGEFQDSHWRVDLTETRTAIRHDPGYQLARHMVLRRPIRAAFLGWAQGYDLEVEHPEHNFLLASGLCCSNSHSAAYALISYQTAWLKAHYPAAFMAAVLSSDMDNTDKVVVFIEECRSVGLMIVPPSVNTSEYRFTVDEQGRILYGLGAIKGVGQAAIESILEERRRQGQFRNVFDFCQRVDLRRVNRRVLESFIRAGAFDGLGCNRASLMEQLPEALRLAEQNSRNDAAGQDDLFNLAVAASPQRVATLAEVCEWEEEQRLAGEKDTLGLYLTGHPITRFQEELRGLTSGCLADVNAEGELGERRYGRGDKQVIVAGLVMGVRIRGANRSRRMAFVILDDRTARMEIRVFPEVYEQCQELIVNDKIVVVQGSLAWDDFSESIRLNAERVLDLDAARNEYAQRLIIGLQASHFSNGLVDHLAATLAPYREGKCPVWVRYSGPGACVEIAFDQTWRVRPAENLLSQLRKLLGETGVRLEYR